jgi:hypothetical protein
MCEHSTPLEKGPVTAHALFIVVISLPWQARAVASPQGSPCGGTRDEC